MKTKLCWCWYRTPGRGNLPPALSIEKRRASAARFVLCLSTGLLALGLLFSLQAATPVGMKPMEGFGGTDGWLSPYEGGITFLGFSNFDRGMAYGNTHVYVVSRADYKIQIPYLDKATGQKLGELPGTDTIAIESLFPVNMIGVAGDGAIYVCNLAVPVRSTTPFRIYRWADETSNPTLAVSSATITGGRLGDSFDVIGSGSSTLLLAGESNQSGSGTRNGYAVFSTEDGTSFAGTLVMFAGTPPLAGDFRLGLTFLDSSHVLGSPGNRWLRYTSFQGENGTYLGAARLFSTAERPMDYAVIGGVPLLASINTSDSMVRVYEVSMTEGLILRAASCMLPIIRPNANGVGAVAWGDVVDNGDGTSTAILYAMNANNGIQAFQVYVGLDFNTVPVAVCKDVTVLAEGDTCSAVASIDDGSYDTDCGDLVLLTQEPPGPYPLGDTPVTLTATDLYGASSTCLATVTVVNPNPEVYLWEPPANSVYPVNTPVSFMGYYQDWNQGGHTGFWSFDDIQHPASFSWDSGGAGMIADTYAFTSQGIYRVKLTIDDSCGGSGTADQLYGQELLVVVYDPNTGPVTGGGWFQSPAGAYLPDPALSGRVNFGFSANYQKGATAPKGQLEIQFHAANLNFHSTAYEWLVVSGNKAQCRGTGRINGADYGFLLTVADEKTTGEQEPDKFRIKLWEWWTGMVVYDNAPGLTEDIDFINPQPLSGGSINIPKEF